MSGPGRRKPRARRSMRFNREGLDVLGGDKSVSKSPRKGDSSTAKQRAREKVAAAAEGDKVGMISVEQMAAYSPSGSAVDQEVNRRSLSRALMGVVNSEAHTVEKNKTIQKAGAGQDAVKQAEECLER